MVALLPVGGVTVSGATVAAELLAAALEVALVVVPAACTALLAAGDDWGADDAVLAAAAAEDVEAAGLSESEMEGAALDESELEDSDVVDAGADDSGLDDSVAVGGAVVVAGAAATFRLVAQSAAEQGGAPAGEAAILSVEPASASETVRENCVLALALAATAGAVQVRLVPLTFNPPPRVSGEASFA
jgi:hypothetical protein